MGAKCVIGSPIYHGPFVIWVSSYVAEKPLGPLRHQDLSVTATFASPRTIHLSWEPFPKAAALATIALGVLSQTGGGCCDIKRKLLSREAFWIFTLGTCVPTGLNVRQDILYQY